MAAHTKKTTPRSTKARDSAPIVAAPDEAAAQAPEASAHPAASRPDPKGKLGAVVTLLRRPGGAQIADLMAATGWQAHSVRGAMSGALKKKLGLTITSEKTDAGRTYRVVTPEAGAAA